MKTPYIISNVFFIILAIFILLAHFFVGISLLWLCLLGLAYFILTAYGSGIIQSRYFFPTIYKGIPQNQSNISISFDDGPDPEFTPQVLDLLDEFNVKATFFCIGNRIKTSPELLQEIDRRGHIIGNHTYSHSMKFGWMNYAKVLEELQATEEIIFEVLQKKSRWFRPPFGVTNPKIAKANHFLGYDVIGWNVRSLDARIKDEKKITKRVIKRLKPGCIVLLHDVYPRVLPVLRNLLEYANENSFNIVPLNELIDNKPYE